MKRVLVITKKSFLELHGKDRTLVYRMDGRTRARFLRADVENRRAIRDVTAFLDREGVSYDALFHGEAAAGRRYDLVLSLGGDGTFFAAARVAGGAPILGINSAPSNSLGIWTSADRLDFRDPLQRALQGRLKGVPLHRMILSINGREMPERALNDALLCHRNPAAMTKYTLEADGRREEQRGSGIWISTAAGSTAGIRSAGGRRMPVHSRRLQFVVREPYTWPERRTRLARGFASRLSVVPLGTHLCVWLDGHRVRRDLRLGDHVEMRPGDPLVILGYDDRRRRRLFP